MKIYVNCADVMKIIGCSKSKAYNIIKEVNAYSIKMKKLAFPSGKANKYLFCELYGISAEDVDKVLE